MLEALQAITIDPYDVVVAVKEKVNYICEMFFFFNLIF